MDLAVVAEEEDDLGSYMYVMERASSTVYCVHIYGRALSTTHAAPTTTLPFVFYFVSIVYAFSYFFVGPHPLVLHPLPSSRVMLHPLKIRLEGYVGLRSRYVGVGLSPSSPCTFSLSVSLLTALLLTFALFTYVLDKFTSNLSC